jgi:hypothetical protein
MAAKMEGSLPSFLEGLPLISVAFTLGAFEIWSNETSGRSYFFSVAHLMP